MFRRLELKLTLCVVKAGPSTGFKGENGWTGVFVVNDVRQTGSR
jgi:hypothetical protein